MLAQRGTLAYEDTLQDVLGPQGFPYSATVTVGDLMGHRAGVRSFKRLQSMQSLHSLLAKPSDQQLQRFLVEEIDFDATKGQQHELATGYHGHPIYVLITFIYGCFVFLCMLCVMCFDVAYLRA